MGNEETLRTRERAAQRFPTAEQGLRCRGKGRGSEGWSGVAAGQSHRHQRTDLRRTVSIRGSGTTVECCLYQN